MSATLAAALQACTCEGNCAMQCGDNVCMGEDPEQACTACVGTPQGCHGASVCKEHLAPRRFWL